MKPGKGISSEAAVSEPCPERTRCRLRDEFTYKVTKGFQMSCDVYRRWRGCRFSKDEVLTSLVWFSGFNILK